MYTNQIVYLDTAAAVCGRFQICWTAMTSIVLLTMSHPALTVQALPLKGAGT